jgi:hypothetical protein
MSQENVELVRRTIDLFNSTEIDQALDGTRDDFEMDWSRLQPAPADGHRGLEKLDL